MTEPFDDMHATYSYASGLSYTDCVFIGRRWRDEYGTNNADSDFWILVNEPQPPDAYTHTRWGPWKNFLTGIWRSASRRVYLCDASLPAMYIYDDVMDTGREPRRDDLDGTLPEGVWGLDDQHVYAWGTRKGKSGAHEHPIHRFDGQRWSEMPAPGFAVTSMHGLAPDLLYAAGWQGGMARWDGGAWTRYPLPTGEVLSDVFVASPDEIYATGLNGALLEGTASGWGLITRTIDERLPFTCVAKWHDWLWVGGGPQGLFRRVGSSSELEHVKPNVKATSFDARGSLVITADNMIVGTSDGQSYRAAGINVLLDAHKSLDIASW